MQLIFNDIEFVDADTEVVKTHVITIYESLVGRTLALGDPIRLFLEAIASIIAQQRTLINYTGAMNMLAFAKGIYLDVIGMLVGTERLAAAKAVTTITVTLSAAQQGSVIVPKGTRVTADGDIMFATTELLEIKQGTVTGTVTAECTTAGTAGNGFLVGEIATIVDPIPFVQTMTNTTTSSSGTDVEDDETYRARIQEAPERFSVAGPTGAYEFYAKSAHPSVIDVSVESPIPGDVHVYALVSGGAPAEQEILDAITSVCNDVSIRPLTDHLYVKAPTQVEYNVAGTYYIDSANSTSATAIQSAVQSAVAEYVAWQKAKLGRDINPSELIHRIIVAGAKRVELTAPTFNKLANSQVAKEVTVTMALGGLEDA